MNRNLEFEHDLQQSIDWQDTKFEDEEAEVDWEETVKNLTKLGYQKSLTRCKEKIAKNILNSLLDKLHEVTGCGTPYQVKKIIKEVAKEYDIEVDAAKYD